MYGFNGKYFQEIIGRPMESYYTLSSLYIFVHGILVGLPRHMLFKVAEPCGLGATVVPISPLVHLLIYVSSPDARPYELLWGLFKPYMLPFIKLIASYICDCGIEHPSVLLFCFILSVIAYNIQPLYI